MIFRNDINSLRAIAVLSVILYHFQIDTFGGGFVGVDIFFVISGYLMTGIIFKRLNNGTLSVLDFYIDRAKRIIPALLVLCMFLLVFGWFYFLAEDYKELGKHVTSSIAFLSNVIYWIQTGDYFAGNAHDKWLLHTWSLSVEWQFYIVYPLVIILLKFMFPERWIKISLCSLCLLSLFLSIHYSGVYPTESFYLLPSRAWEMLLGGLIILYPVNLSRKLSSALSFLGITVIFLSIYFLDQDNLWPGYLALLPVLGTTFVIIANDERSFISKSLILAQIGKISYSVYLWHWPIVVALNLTNQLHKPMVVLGGLLLSFVFGYMSFILVELKTQKLFKKTSKYIATFLLVLVSCLVAGLGAYIYQQDGFQNRVNSNHEVKFNDLVMPSIVNNYCFYSVATIKNLEPSFDGTNCHIGNVDSRTTGLLIGDSYAGHYEPFWDELGKSFDLKINSITSNWCHPSLTKSLISTNLNSVRQCKINRVYTELNIYDYDFVIISASLNSLNIKEVIDFINFASKNVKQVFLMPPPFTYEVDITKRFKYSSILGTKIEPEMFFGMKDLLKNGFYSKLSKLALSLPNVTYIERSHLFFSNNKPLHMSKEGVPISLDGKHLSVYGSLKVFDAFKDNKFKYNELEIIFSDM